MSKTLLITGGASGIGVAKALTEAGLELARTVRLVAEEWDQFAQRIDAMKGLRRGRLRVAIVSTAEYFVPRLVGSFCRRYRLA